MTVVGAIQTADSLRPNKIDAQMKSAWVYEVDEKLKETMGISEYKKEFPKDQVLLMPPPYDNIYYLYLCAMIDFHLRDSAQYQSDMELYNKAYADARAWWRRSHPFKDRRYWKGL